VVRLIIFRKIVTVPAEENDSHAQNNTAQYPNPNEKMSRVYQGLH
jgi:hypothetical protein